MAMLKASYAHRAPTTGGFLYKTIPQLLDERSQTSPDQESYVFLTYNNKSSRVRYAVTWKQLADRSMGMAAGFLEMGLEPGDRIAICGDSLPEWLYVSYACARIKVLMIEIPASIAYSDDLAVLLRQHRVKVLVLDHGQDPGVVEKMNKHIHGLNDMVYNGTTSASCQFPSKVLFLRDRLEGSTAPVVADYIGSERSNEAAIREIQASIDPDDPACMYATSGSTGVPKMVLHSHFTITNVHVHYKELIGSGEGQKYFNDRPFSWLGSLRYYPLVNGSTRVQMSTPDSKQEAYITTLISVIEEENINAAFLLNDILHDIRNLIKSKSDGNIRILPSSLERICTAGEKIPYDLFRDIGNVDGLCIIGIYASSETPIIARCSSNDDDYSAGDGSDGRLLYRTSGHVEMKIVDDNGTCVPRGTPGLILTRQAYCFIGYLDDPDMTSATISPSRWMSLGDMAVMHESGGFDIQGRTSDVIIKNYVKIYRSKQETMLLRHSKVGKVVVCGIPHEIYNEEICACVEPKPGCDVTEDELLQHCLQHQPSVTRVALYPTIFIICQHIPTNQNGKVDMQKIRGMFVDRRIK